MVPLTAAQVKEHPEFTKVIWDLKPTQEGTAQVAEGRGGPLTFPIKCMVQGTFVW